MSVRSMKSRSSVRSLGVLAAMALLGVCGTAVAQPTLVLTGGISDDMSSDGRKAVGYFFDFSIPAYVPYIWERGVGFTQVPGTVRKSSRREKRRRLRTHDPPSRV